jgi:hypothetical protein
VADIFSVQADTSALGCETPDCDVPAIVQPPPLPNQPTAAVADVSAPLADQSVPSPEVTSVSVTPLLPLALTPRHAACILHEHCPACFGLEEWGWPLEESAFHLISILVSHRFFRGGDIQIGGDGCFSYRHNHKARDGPISYNPTCFIPKAKVDAVGDHITQARKKKLAKLTHLIPQEVLDACNTTFDATNESKRNTDPKYYDASGVFVICCRHSQVLFLMNIDTSGEQQKYIIAGLEEVFSLLPQ